VTRRPLDPFEGYDPFRLHVFVPAIMSAGLLFSLATLVRDAVAKRDHRRTHHRTEAFARSSVDGVVGGLVEPLPTEPSVVLPRGFSAVVATAALVAACYLVPGAVLNYLRPNGYVSNIAWLLCLSLLVGTTLATVGAATVVAAFGWPRPSATAERLTSAVFPPFPPLTTDPPERTQRTIGVATLLAVASLTFVVLGVGVGRFRGVDAEVAEAIARWDLPEGLGALAVVGSTPVTLLLATLVGVVAVRCRTFAAAWIGSVLVTFAADNLLKAVIERPRPTAGPLVGLHDSFPSGHLAQLMLLAVVAPVALRVLSTPPRVRVATGALLVVGACVAALERVDGEVHWPMDVLGGALLGLTVGLALRWIVEHRDWHLRCPRCPWSADGGTRR
jgi:membrane-associated phospholipid phosphatase